jgi:large subunit ribosomal protein L30
MEKQNKSSSKKAGKAAVEKKRLALIRIRGKVHLRGNIGDTLELLNLSTVNSCVVIDNRPEYKGMINKVNDYVTWGEVDAATFKELMEKRARLDGNKSIDDAYLKGKTKYGSIKEFSDAFMKFEANLSDIPEVKKFFRLSPPIGGHGKKGIKKSNKVGGALGYRGKEIKELIERMI